MKNFFLLFFVLTFNNPGFSQRNYDKLFRVLKPDSSSHSTALFFSIDYCGVPKSNTIEIGGLSINGGLNLGRFFSNKIHVGISLEFNGFKMLMGEKLSSQFKSDFDNNFISFSSKGSHDDSLKINLLRAAVNKRNGNEIFGSYLFGYGFSFSPFPFKYGGLMLEYKVGGYVFPVYSVYGKIINGIKSENEWIGWDIGYKKISLTTRQFYFLTEDKWNCSFRLGVFYQALYLSNSNIEGVSVSKFMSNKFLDKYYSTKLFGVQIQFGLW